MHPTPAHPFFLRRKDAKTYQRGSVLFEITSGGKYPPQWSKDHAPPRLSQNFQQERGERDRAGGTNPQKRAVCYVGLCTPRPHILSFYEERMQRRIKEEVSSLKSPRGGKFPPKSLCDVPPPFITKVWCITGGVERGQCPLSVGGQGTKRFLVCLW